MAVYGLDFYSTAKYGMDIPVQYSVEPFTAMPTAPGTVHLHWSPSKEDDWTLLRLVRNPLGLPGDADDGNVLLESGHEGLTASYLDTGLTQGRLYYYSLFVAAPPDPGTTSPGTWIRAGNTTALAMGDHRYAERMYGLIPRAYRTALQEITGYEDGITNQTLYRFLQILGLQYDTIKTELDLRTRIHDQRYTTFTQTQHTAESLGVEPALSARPALRRTRVHNATATARAKGSPDGLRRIIRDLTGWDATIDNTPNLMVDQDQSGIWHPTLQDWKPGIRYAEGEYVQYGASVYKAKGSSKTYSAAQLLPPAALSSQGRVRRQNYMGERAFAENFKLGDSFTLEFDVATAGEYDAYGIYTTSHDFAIWDTELDGTKIHTGFGGYSPYVMPVGVSLGRWTLTTGKHRLRFVSTGKNDASTGYQMGVNQWTITPTGTLRAADVPPQGHPDSTLFWSPEPTPRDWALERNPLTLDPSTWMLFKDATLARLPSGSLGIQTGATAVDSPYSGTSLTFTTPEDQQSYTLSSVANAQIRPWTPTTDYTLGNLVTYQGTTWEALASVTDGQEPGHSPAHWRPSLMTTNRATPDSSLITSYGIPLRPLHDWTPNTAYQPGDLVIHGRYRYQAVLASTATPPSSGPRDSRAWSYAGPNTDVITASSHARFADGKPLPDLAVDVWWYGDQSDYLTWSSRTTTAAVLDRFDYHRTTLSGTPLATTSWITGGGTWSVQEGAARVAPVTAPDGTYCTLALFEPPPLSGTAPGSQPFTVSGTFVSRPADPTARQGVALSARPDMAAFTLAARDGVYRAWLANGTYTLTRLGAYPELKDGERITVAYEKGQLVVKKSSGDGYQMTDLLTLKNPEMTGTYVGFAEIKGRA
ncbi:carbohydrate-binding protein [Streptomyces olivoreticuli]